MTNSPLSLFSPLELKTKSCVRLFSSIILGSVLCLIFVLRRHIILKSDWARFKMIALLFKSFEIPLTFCTPIPNFDMDLALFIDCNLRPSL